MNVNLENLEILKQNLRDLNLGMEVNFYQMSFITHELTLYLENWAADESTDWIEFVSKNHLLQNDSKEQNLLDLKVLINLRNALFYKTFDRSQSFRCLKEIQKLELEIKKVNRSRAAITTIKAA